MNIFVTDGSQRPALAIVRSLGRRGHSIVVGDDRPASLAGSSRYCARRVTYPSPYRNRQAFDEFLLDFVAREPIDVVLPVTDVTMRSACQHQEALARHCALAVPPFPAFELVTDKWTLVQWAARCGVPTPRTAFVADAGRLADVIDDVRYPAVVKPLRSRMLTEFGWQPASVHYADSPAELRALYVKTDYLASYPSLIQERIDGPGVGMFALFERGCRRIEFAHKRLREKPPSGGAAVLSESIAVDPALRTYADRMLGPTGWHGVAMLEFKQDRRTGAFYLIEVNGRFWGSLQLAIDAGVDFPHLACELATGGRPAAPASYTTGATLRWVLGDLDHLLIRLKSGSATARWRAMADFLKANAPGTRHEVNRADDLGPCAYEATEYVSALFRSARRRLGEPARQSHPVKHESLPRLPADMASEG